MPRLRPAAVGLALLVALTGCSGQPEETASRPAGPPAASTRAVDDVCALVPVARLRAAIGADPGAGVPSKGPLNGGQCVWTVSTTRRVLAQYTPQPDVFLPEGVVPRPRSATEVRGATRGFAAGESGTVLVVKDRRGLLLKTVGFDGGDQAAYEALAEAIVANL
ncbi:hypothetical protein [Amnibacterium endophyticum]|uniref:DUF3558 domain-containing protein n=1 Tax=Amnibacterium endophyticum TaxID=2109337 RepID=A0ABW4LKJ1_9MICO